MKLKERRTCSRFEKNNKLKSLNNENVESFKMIILR